MTSRDDRLPVDFRHADVDPLFRLIRTGESCSLVGIGSVGKSNLMHTIARDEVKRTYLNGLAATTIMVMLDPHKLVHLEEQALRHSGSGWPGYELMLSRLRRALIDMEDQQQLPPGSEVIQRVERFYINLFDAQPLMAQTGVRQLENAIYEVLGLGSQWRIVFLFDELESFLHLPASFFQSLRGLRDEFKQRIVYITTSRRPVSELIQERVTDALSRETMEGFVELVQGFIRFVRLLEPAGAEIVIQQLERRYSVALDPVRRRYLIDVSGRHAGLLRRSFLPTAGLNATATSVDQLFEVLLRDRSVLHECQVILDSLPSDEQTCLQQLVLRQPVPVRSLAWESLVNKEIVTLSGQGEPTLMLPLLAGFLVKRLNQT